MFYQLRRHPLPIVAHFDHCLVLTYAVPADCLRPLLPRGLQLETVDRSGPLGLVAVALVQTRNLRPAGTPTWCGHDFFLSGYRIFTRFESPKRRLRGLKILRSDTDRRAMQVAGNLLTHYNYRLARVESEVTAERLGYRICTPRHEADLHVEADLTGAGNLPSGSCFASVAAARRFAGPLPYTFDVEPQTDSIVAIHAARTAWSPRCVHVDVRQITFFDQPPFRDVPVTLAAAFHVSNVDYRWERGVRFVLPGTTP